jgi:hypothetical protein
VNAFIAASLTAPGSAAMPKLGKRSAVPQSCASTIGLISSYQFISTSFGVLPFFASTYVKAPVVAT